MSNIFRNLTMLQPKRALRSRALIPCAAFCISGFGVLPDAKAAFTTFDAPGSFKTAAASINSTGSIAGSYEPNHGRPWHGFVRAPDGTITPFDPKESTNTYAYSINDTGSIAGWYYDNASARHGFVRAADGTITKIDVPGSAFTDATSINATGSIAGHYGDNSGPHGFVRAADGTFTSFDLSGSSDIYVSSINNTGVVAGVYWNSDYTAHGFVRARNGTITAFDAPGSSYTYAYGLNGKGAIAGGYEVDILSSDHSHPRSYGFARAADGTIARIDVPGSFDTYAASINAKGVIAGAYGQGGGFRGFVRAADGTIETFGTPGPGHTTATRPAPLGSAAPASGRSLKIGTPPTLPPPTGLFPSSINDQGAITGRYTKDGIIVHGFLLTP